MKKIAWMIAVIVMLPFTVNATSEENVMQKDINSLDRYYTFTMRISAPSESDYRYYSARNPYYKWNMPMPNCTTYAYGRFWEVYGDEPQYPLTLAKHPSVIYWYAKNDANSAYRNHVGLQPGLGAIAVWSTIPNDNPNAGASEGHVAIVERVESNGDIYTSNSGYPNSNFYMQTYSRANNYNYVGSNGKTYYFQGFVYQPKNHFIIS